MCVRVCERELETVKENMSICGLDEARERYCVCVCDCGVGDSRAILCMMYHVADCVAAAITSKNKGLFMSRLTDLVFINVLAPPAYPPTATIHTPAPLPPFY